jgi:hypothetical protein
MQIGFGQNVCKFWLKPLKKSANLDPPAKAGGNLKSFLYI